MKAILIGGLAGMMLAGTALAANADKPPSEVASPGVPVGSPPEVVTSEGSVTIGTQRLDYRALAGTLTVHAKGWNEMAADGASQPAVAAMYFVAYLSKRPGNAPRPLTFIFNGGPGASSMWLHMGAFGPKRVLVRDAAHTSGPYRIAENEYSLLDASDVVFVDAPGLGFGRISGEGREKAFFGVDEDAHAFAEFITTFLSRFDRWNSPVFLCGESYGTPRSAVLSNLLASAYNLDVSGVILLSQILNYDLGEGASSYNPGTDQPYVVALPSYAAAAWYHNRLPEPRPASLPEYLHGVERFALTDYAVALQAGASLAPERRAAVAQQIAAYTALPVGLVLQSDLRLDSRVVRQHMLEGRAQVIGDIDGRYAGLQGDPLAKGAEDDPTMAAISSAFFTALNVYTRQTLNYRSQRAYQVSLNLMPVWNWIRPQPANAPTSVFGFVNVMPDLAAAMKRNPHLQVMVNGGYYDLSTSYFESWYEMHHLPIPAALQDNIEYHYYQSGHMTFLHEPSLKELHANVADFIRRATAASR